MPQTKAQQVGVRSQRIVFLSSNDDEFSRPVHESLRGKFSGRVDEFKRPIEILSRGARTAGERAAVLPWDPYVPTDVVVLLSDKYTSQYVSKLAIADDDVEHDLNIVLRLRAKLRTTKDYADYNVWLGVVQDSDWKNVSIEGVELSKFLHLMHPMLGGKTLEDDPQDKRVLDKATFAAAAEVKRHDPDRCLDCKGDAPAQTGGGFFRRWFGQGRG